MSRWIRVQTSIFEHEVFAAGPFSEREAWIWLISKAAWKDTKHRIGQTIADVPAGSMFLTLREMQRAWKWKSDKRVRTFLTMLENERMIETKTDAGKTQISICNYSRYQEVGRTEDATETHGGRSADALKTPIHQDTNTSSLRSEARADAPKKRGSRLPNDFEPDLDFAESQGLSRSQAEREAASFRDYWPAQPGQRGVKTDWQATWRNWVRKATERLAQPVRGSPSATRSRPDPFKDLAQELSDGQNRSSRSSAGYWDDAQGVPLITADYQHR